uniref:Orc1-like AAA ATPase domain-containing protein n=1 Tax=Entomoneis paludosa TaxID=265537 RepID=A0A7S2YPK4_9STRA|mmetsp:Transcript_4129/g.8858  ORF Transcript_4129/g.8858 Transcript_4129/m.8858 type:complete len:1080 (+) Transcript_4129:418-3657(+)
MPKTLPFRPSGRFRKSSDDTTMDKLQFEKVGLHGRAKELQLLKEALKRTIVPTTNTSEEDTSCHQLILLAGETGVGKSALAQKFMESTRSSKDFSSSVCLSGKFDQEISMQQPFAAFTGCIQILVGHLLMLQSQVGSNGEETGNEVVAKFQNELDSQLDRNECQVLASTFEDLRDLLLPKLGPPKNEMENNPSNRKSQVHGAFRKFLRIAADLFRPLVFCIDDLHWADTSSLEILELMVTDPKCAPIMVIGLYRSNEVDETHKFAKTMRDLQQRVVVEKTTKLCEIQRVDIGNLDEEATKAVLSEILNSDQHDALGTICYQKTQGNAFFLMSFLRALHANEYLKFNFGTFQWTYELEDIKAGMGSTENVAKLVQQRIAQLDHPAKKELIKLAGCLGARFKDDILELLWNGFVDAQSDETLDFESTMQSLLKESIFQVDGFYLRWVHDSIQHSAARLVQGTERELLLTKLAKYLIQNLEQEQLEASIFVVTNLCNSGATPTDAKERIQVAELNSRSAQLASAMSALDIAKEYGQSGLALLPDDKWDTHPELTKKLYAVCCRIYMNLGEFDKVEDLSSEFLGRDDIPQVEQIPVFLCRVTTLEFQEGKLTEAMDLCIAFLEKLGIKLPRSTVTILASTAGVVLSLKRVSKRISVDDILELPVVKNELTTGTMQVLDKLIGLAIMTASPMFPLLVFRAMKMTLKHGATNTSPIAFTQLGILTLAIFGDIQGSGVWASRSLTLLDRIPNPELCKSRTLFLSSFFVLPWSQPLNSMIKPLMTAYEVGLASGDIESAVYAIGTYVTIAVMAGRPLEGLWHDCRVYFGQMKQLGRERLYVNCNVQWQMIANLMGRAEDHLTLTGEAMNQDEFMVKALDPTFENNLGTFYWARAFLFAVFGSHVQGAAHAMENGLFIAKKFPAYPPAFCILYYMGISLISMFKRDNVKAHKKRAQLFLKKLEDLKKQGNPNVQHFHLGLTAEFLALKNKKLQETLSTFEKSIAVATRSGFIMDAALMNERYAEFLLGKDPERATHHFKTAHSLYMEWGSTMKCDLLQAKYPDLMRPPVDIVIDGGSSRQISMGSFVI